MDESQLVRKLLDQLREIFPTALLSSEWRPTPDVPVSRADVVAETSSGRLLLFDVKNLKSQSRPPSSWYLQLASYRDHLIGLAEASPPILALAINTDVDDQIRDTFGRSGIPVFQIGHSAAETRAHMQEAFSQVAIELPELRSHVAGRRSRSLRCFVSMPARVVQSSATDRAIDMALHALDAEVVGSRTASHGHLATLRQRATMIRSSDVLVADVSDQDPAVMLDAGMAVASGVPMVLLTREGDVPVDLGGERVVRYSMSDEGLDRLRTRLAEVLREMAIRSESR
jgi:hypothetical protein